MIPSLASPKQNPRDWYARFVTVKNTFSARIGQICNAALDRSVIAYNEKTEPKLRKQFKEETEVLAILSGLEIDAAKTGIRPDLSDYLGKKIPRTPFLKYKTMVEAAEERREWYEDAQGEVKLEYLTTLVAYYLANKPEDSNWVVLPSTNFNCYFGSTVFSKKVLREITGKIIQRSDTSYGSGRYRVLEEFL